MNYQHSKAFFGVILQFSANNFQPLSALDNLLLGPLAGTRCRPGRIRVVVVYSEVRFKAREIRSTAEHAAKSGRTEMGRKLSINHSTEKGLAKSLSSKGCLYNISIHLAYTTSATEYIINALTGNKR